MVISEGGKVREGGDGGGCETIGIAMYLSFWRGGLSWKKLLLGSNSW